MNEIKFENKDGVAVIAIKGNFWSQDSGEDLVGKFKSLAEDYIHSCEERKIPPKIIVDMKEVTVTNATGLGVLVNALSKARRLQGDVILVNLYHKKVNTLFEITQLSKVFTVASSMEEALKK